MTTTRRSYPCLPRPSVHSVRLLGAVPLRTANRAPPHRLRRRPGGGHRRRSSAAGMPAGPGGCAVGGPGRESTVPSVVPASGGGGVFGAAGSHLLVGIPAVLDRLLGQPEQTFGLDRI